MEDLAVRDIERGARTAQWKDKIEIQLDNRQVFFLFFGSAVVACMLFVLGVIVGKRIESRGRAEAPEVQDPLAVLDRAGSHASLSGAPAAPEELTFPKTLITSSATPVPAPKPKAPPAPLTPPPAPAPSKPVALAAAVPKPAPPPRPAAPPKVVAPIDPAKAPKGKFTLHLATLASKDEADTLAKKFAGAFVVSSDVPGKGLVYRVRWGNYASYQEATAAKASFEKQNRTIALVAAR